MKHRYSALVLAAFVTASTSVAHARDLTIVSWGGPFQEIQREIYFEPYKTQSGKTMLDEAWDGGYGVVQAKVKAGTPNWDVINIEADELELGCTDGMFEPLDWSKIGKKEDFLPNAVTECGIGNVVWSTGLAYDKDVFKEGPKSWADFWDTKKFPGKRALRKTPRYTLEFALMADGVPAADVYSVLGTPEGVERAFAKLDELKPSLVWWEAGSQPVQLLSSKEVAMTSVYNGRISGINRSEGKNFAFVFPQSIYSIDSWAVLKGSPNKDQAMEFIGFVSSPEQMVKMPEHMAYGPTNIAAAQAVPAKYVTELPTTEENMKDAIPLGINFWIDNSEELTKRFTAWLAQ